MSDFVFQIGCDWSRTITYNDSNNAPINLTGYSVKMQVRATNNSHDSVKILDLSSPDNGISITGVEGKININITHTQLTEPLLKLDGITTPAGPVTESSTLNGFGKIAVFDILLTAPSGLVTKLMGGKACFVPAITRG